MNFNTQEEVLLKKSLDHSVRTGQFEYTRHETEATRALLNKVKNKDRPKIVGYWAIQITPDLEFIKFGKNDDTVFPYDRPSTAIAQCHHLMKAEPDCRYYILRVFSNGQMKTFEVDKHDYS